MRSSATLLLSALISAGCASAGTSPSSTAGGPSRPAATTPPAPTAAPRSALEEPPENWHLLDPVTDRIAGIGSLRAERELLAGRQPRRTVVVAVIDNGVDTSHADLRANLWINARETPANRADDDRNGYVDDVRGWNFLGGADGRNIDHETLEVTRLFRSCDGRPAMGDPPAPAAAECERIKAAYAKERSEAQQMSQMITGLAMGLSQLIPLLQAAVAPDSLTPARARALQPTRPELAQARDLYLQLAEAGITPAVIEEQREVVSGMMEYWLNPGYNPRAIVGDDPRNVAQRGYGNPDVGGPDPDHGTHVAGIIGGVRGNGIGVDGIAPAVRLMAVRAVPDGDERDKDVANAIRYAVDNGANILNMSFGKAFSPQKEAVDEAVKYAESRGVLLVHGAGNDGEDIGTTGNFPTPAYAAGGRAGNWIEVGASTWRGGDSLAATFSNYGDAEVDVFAPGVDIYSSVAGGKYKRESGTSMAAPVVTGLAALIMAHYPDLSAADVKRIILASASRYNDQMVARPGEGDARIAFGSLSVTGGVVNAYNAIRMAEELSRGPR